MTQGQAHKALAVFFGILAAIAGFVFLRMRWHRGADFDITGFLWLMQNLPRLTVLVLFITCVGVAISYGFRSYRAGG